MRPFVTTRDSSIVSTPVSCVLAGALHLGHMPVLPLCVAASSVAMMARVMSTGV
jgi:hypothetical protein